MEGYVEAGMPVIVSYHNRRDSQGRGVNAHLRSVPK